VAVRKTKLIYVVSNVDYALGFDWLDAHLDRHKYDVEFILLNAKRPPLFDVFRERGVNVRFYGFRSKKSYPLLFLKLLFYFLRHRPSIVHAHLFDANLLAITSAFIARVPKRVYTRHHSTFHFDYHPHMVKYDRIVNFMSTHIAAISENVKSVLVEREKVSPEKVFMVNHGFELDLFSITDKVRAQELRAKYNPEGRSPVIGVISRFTHWKGIQYIIPAFKSLLSDYPGALLILANAKGEYASELEVLMSEIPDVAMTRIPFERDLSSLYQLFDVFVHVPIDEEAEAFGQVYVEALAAGVPSLFTMSGIAREFIDDSNAVIVPFKDTDAIYRGVKRLLSDDAYRQSLVRNGKLVVYERFQIENMMQALYNLYEA
jgi:glycosyltransferase involved in cell wall biosynthesis